MWKGQPEVWVRAGGYFTPFGHSLFFNRRNYFPIANSTSQFFKWFLGDKNVQLSIAFVPYPDLTSSLKNKTPTHICWQKKPSAHFWQCSFYWEVFCCREVSYGRQDSSQFPGSHVNHISTECSNYSWVRDEMKQPNQVQGFDVWCLPIKIRTAPQLPSNIWLLAGLITGSCE